MIVDLACTGCGEKTVRVDMRTYDDTDVACRSCGKVAGKQRDIREWIARQAAAEVGS